MSSFTKAVAITKDDNNDLLRTSNALYVGSAGTLKVTLKGDIDANAVTFAAVPAGTILNIKVKKVWATGSVASSIIALY